MISQLSKWVNEWSEWWMDSMICLWIDWLIHSLIHSIIHSIHSSSFPPSLLPPSVPPSVPPSLHSSIQPAIHSSIHTSNHHSSIDTLKIWMQLTLIIGFANVQVIDYSERFWKPQRFLCKWNRLKWHWNFWPRFCTCIQASMTCLIGCGSTSGDPNAHWCALHFCHLLASIASLWHCQNIWQSLYRQGKDHTDAIEQSFPVLKFCQLMLEPFPLWLLFIVSLLPNWDYFILIKMYDD